MILSIIIFKTCIPTQGMLTEGAPSGEEEVLPHSKLSQPSIGRSGASGVAPHLSA